MSYTFETATSSLKILEENNYYPFGLKQNGYNMTKKTYEYMNGPNAPRVVPTVRLNYQYKYNGKELQDELGLNFYDYVARNYDPALGRWMNIDPLAETSRRFSPYAYAINNPVFFIDPDGMEAVGADGLTNSEWSSNNRRNIDSQMGGNGIDIGSMTYNTKDEREQKKKDRYSSNLTVTAEELIEGEFNQLMHQGDRENAPKPKFRWRHLLGPDAIYIAITEDLGIGLGVGFEQGAIIILKGKDVGIYPAYDFGIGLHTASGTVAIEAVSLYYSGETVTKDVFYGNRYEFNFGADAFGHIGLTALYAPIKGGGMVWGSGISLGAGFSATIISGSLNYGRTQSNGDKMIPILARNK